MPRQLIHDGKHFHLIPMKNPDDTPGPPTIGNGWRDPADGDVINDQEPSVFLDWSKSREEIGDFSSMDIGYVHLTFEVTEDWLRRQLSYLDNWGPDVAKPEKVHLSAGPLSWRDLNVLAKTAKSARDGAFGKPE